MKASMQVKGTNRNEAFPLEKKSDYNEQKNIYSERSSLIKWTGVLKIYIGSSLPTEPLI